MVTHAQKAVNKMERETSCVNKFQLLGFCVWPTAWSGNGLIASAFLSNKRLFALCRALRPPTFATRRTGDRTEHGRSHAGTRLNQLAPSNNGLRSARLAAHPHLRASTPCLCPFTPDFRIDSGSQGSSRNILLLVLYRTWTMSMFLGESD